MNIVCEKAVILGSVRAFSLDVFNFMVRRIHEIAADVDKEFGTKTEVHLTEGYPPVNNDPALYEDYKKAMEKAGITLLEAEKTMIAEDFSEYEARYPGVFGCWAWVMCPPCTTTNLTLTRLSWPPASKPLWACWIISTKNKHRYAGERRENRLSLFCLQKGRSFHAVAHQDQCKPYSG